MELDKTELEALVARVAQEEVGKVMKSAGDAIVDLAIALQKLETELEALGLDPDEIELQSLIETVEVVEEEEAKCS